MKLLDKDNNLPYRDNNLPQEITEGFTFGNKQVYKIVKPEAHSIIVGIEYEYNVSDEMTVELGEQYGISVSEGESESDLNEDAWLDAVDEYTNDIIKRHREEWIDSYVDSEMNQYEAYDVTRGITSVIKDIEIGLKDREDLKNLKLFVQGETAHQQLIDNAKEILTILNAQEDIEGKTLKVLPNELVGPLFVLIKLPHLVTAFQEFINTTRLHVLASRVDTTEYSNIYNALPMVDQRSLTDPDVIDNIDSAIQDLLDVDNYTFPVIPKADWKLELSSKHLVKFDNHFDDVLMILNAVIEDKILPNIKDIITDLETFVDEMENVDLYDLLETSIKDSAESNYNDLAEENIEEQARQEAYDNVSQDDYREEVQSSTAVDTKINVIDAALQDTENKWGIDYSTEISSVIEDSSVPEGVETISNAIPLLDQIELMKKMFKHINDVGGTADNTGMHVNMSIKGLNFSKDNFDPVKMVMLLDNNYLIGKSVDKQGRPLIKYPARTNVGDMLEHIGISSAMDLAKAYVNVGESELIKQFGLLIRKNTKYQGINFNNTFTEVGFYEGNTRRVEFRYMGGSGYEDRLDEMTFDIYRFAYAMMAGYSPTFGQEDYYKAIVKTLDKVVATKSSQHKFADLISMVKRGENPNTVNLNKTYLSKRKYFDTLIKIVKDAFKENNLPLTRANFTSVDTILANVRLTHKEEGTIPEIDLYNIDSSAIEIVVWKLNPEKFDI